MASPQPGQLGVASRASRASTSDPIILADSIVRPDSTSPAGTAVSQHRRNDESWVEIASQPSSSSLSSIGDDIVTTGLRVGNQSYPPRRRRLQHHYHQSLQHQQQQRQEQMPQSYFVNHPITQPASTSSQEEYDETESEEDRMITSSTENVDTRPLGLQRSQTAIGPGASSLSDSEDDDDGTALGTSPTHSFRPRPNAFSHPPPVRSHSATSAIPSHHPIYTPASRLHTRARPDYRSPSYQADRDEALRASLTTLLSCAAAAKSLPGKRGGGGGGTNIVGPSAGEPVLGAGVSPASQPMELRLVPESELTVNASPPPVDPCAPKSSRTRQATARTSSNSSAQSGPLSVSSRGERGKRIAATGQSKPQRAAKKKKTAAAAAAAAAVDDSSVTWISPATLTWVLGTGVVLLISVVGFGAGFVVGREIGRQEVFGSPSGSSGAAVSAASNSTSCGSEVIRSTSTGTLKRWRWGTGMGRSVIA